MPLDEADLAAIQKLIDARSAADAQTRDEDRKRADASRARLDAANQAKADAQAAAEAAAATAHASQPQADGGDDADKKAHAATLRARAETEALLARLKAAEKAASDAEAHAKESNLKNAVRSGVSELFPKEHIENVMARLTVDGRFIYDEHGQPALRFQRDGYEDVLPLGEGLKEFAESDTGKVFTPPSNTQGTGDSVSRKVPRTSEGKADWDLLKDQARGLGYTDFTS